jgi:Domain of unknown function (DUF4249)
MQIRTRDWKVFIFITIASLMLPDCVQQYVSPYKSPATGYLVVDGYLSGNSPTQYTLSRSIPLPGDSAIPAVTGASVQVEGNDNSVYPLSEQGGGSYGADTLILNTTVKYRLRIAIPGGETYLSDYVPYKPTPPIDSVNWVYDPSTGVTIYANTHDPTNSTRYYQWKYLQTYEYNSAEYSGFFYDHPTNAIIPRPLSQQIYTCWKNVPVYDIVIGNSTKLAQDVIYEHPLVVIAPNTQPLSVEYSILVSQYSLTDSGYNFLSQMQQNTEALGSIFDQQPTQITGNIHSLSNPTEQVIGYVSAGTLQQKRIFINRFQLADWLWLFRCGDPDKIIPNDPDSFPLYLFNTGYIPVYQQITQSGSIVWAINDIGCVDCRAQGGTTTKPDYWPTN